MIGPVTRGAVARALLAAALVAALYGCAVQRPGGSERPAPVRIPTTAQPVDGLGAWYADGVLRLGDRTQPIPGVRAFAIAPHTIVYLDRHARLCFSNLRETSCSDYRTFMPVISPDGARVGFLDRAHGEKDEYGTRMLVATVLDLRTGRILATSTAGMGDPDTDDLADLYEDAEATFVGFTGAGDAVVEDTTGGYRVLPADGGKARARKQRPRLVTRDVPGEVVTLHRTPGAVRIVPGTADSSTNEGRLSPDRRFLVTGTEQADGDLHGAPAPSGRLFPLTGAGEPWWGFGVWAGPHQFLATTSNEQQTRLDLYRCDLSTRDCTRIRSAPIKTGDVDAVLFPSGAGSDAEGLLGAG